MIWVGWRQQRTETLIAAVLLAVLAAVLVPTGLHMAAVYRHDGIGACLGRDPSESCSTAINAFSSRFAGIGTLLDWLTLLPGLLGVLLAAPLAVQLEQGTYRLDWTQSITRRRWLAGKLGLALVAALLAALVLVLLMTWWRAPLVRLNGRMDNSVFDGQGTVVFGYTLFALGLASALGAVWRRSVPALVVAFFGYFAARFFCDAWLRQRLLAPISETWRGKGEPAALFHAWVLSEYPSDRAGRLVAVPCAGLRSASPSHTAHVCVPRFVGYMHAVYEPASRFWALQLRETALFGGTGLLLLALAAWWTYARAS